MKIFFYILLFLFCIINHTDSRPLIKKKAILAINVGSDHSKRATSGIIYESDNYYDENTTITDYRKDPDYEERTIWWTNDPKIYLTLRTSQESFKYQLPLTKVISGRYTLIFKFCEHQYKTEGKRQFNIKFGDQVIVKQLDIFQKSGKQYAAYDEYIEFDYNKEQNKIIYKKNEVLNAIQDDQLQVTFEQVVGDPIVAGILFYGSHLSETNFYDLRFEKEKWEMDYKKEMRKKMKAKRDANQVGKDKMTLKGDYDQDFEKIENKGEKKNHWLFGDKHVPPLKELLMTPMGVLAMISTFTVSFVLIYFTFCDPYGIDKMKYELQNKVHLSADLDEDYEEIDEDTVVTRRRVEEEESEDDNQSEQSEQQDETQKVGKSQIIKKNNKTQKNL